MNFSTLHDLNGNVDLLTEKLTQTIKDAAKLSIPKSGTSVRKKCVPWWNQQIALAIKEKRKFFRKFQRSLDQNDMIAKQKVRKMIRDSKKLYIHEYISKIDLRHPSSLVYQMISRMNGNYRSRKITTLIYHENTYTNPVEIIEIISQIFPQIQITVQNFLLTIDIGIKLQIHQNCLNL